MCALEDEPLAGKGVDVGLEDQGIDKVTVRCVEWWRKHDRHRKQYGVHACSIGAADRAEPMCADEFRFDE